MTNTNTHNKYSGIDFPKLQSPFVRKDFEISKDDFKKYKSTYNLRTPVLRLVTPKINPGYEWVFEDPDTIATEKLDGTNIQLNINSDLNVDSVYNRKNKINILNLQYKRPEIIMAIFKAIDKNYIKKEAGNYYGEVIGPKLQGNPYQLNEHIWYPFNKAISSLKYKSFNNHERTFDNLSFWFENYLTSLFYSRAHKVPINDSIFAEGVVFYNLKRKEEGKTYMCKLRRNMFPWFYKGIEIK